MNKTKNGNLNYDSVPTERLKQMALTAYERSEMETDFERVIPMFSELIRREPDNPQLYFLRAYSLGKTDSVSEAIEDFTKAIELAPKVPDAYIYRGSVLSAKGKYSEAEKDFNRAIELEPEKDDGYGLRASAFLDLGRFAEAIEDYTRAIYFAPDEATYYYNRGSAYEKTGRYDEAFEDRVIAMELDPDEPEYLNGYGADLYNRGRYDEAIDCYSKAAELNPEKPMFYSNRGNARIITGETEKAIDDYKQAVSLDPDEPYWYISVGYQLAKAGLTEEALAYAAKAAGLGHESEQYENIYEHYEGLGDIMKALGRNKEAADYYTVAIDLAPDQPELYKERAEAYRAFGKKYEADSDMEEAAKLEKQAEETAGSPAAPSPAGKPDQQKTVNPTAAEIIRLLEENTSKKTAEMRFMKQRAPLTGSKLGGVPFIPEGGPYPTDADTGEKLYLLLQINFEEMPPVPDFPQKGLLQIFIGAGDTYGCDFDGSQDSWRILYHEDISRPMPRKNVLELMPGLPEDGYMLPFEDPESEYRIRFTGADMPVSTDDFRFQQAFSTYCRDALPDGLRGSKYDDLPSEITDDVFHKLYNGGSRVGGYPVFAQDDPRGCSVPENYELLLQVDSDDDNGDKSAVMWGDCGVASFFIDPEDLKKRDFSKVFYTWDCC